MEMKQKHFKIITRINKRITLSFEDINSDVPFYALYHRKYFFNQRNKKKSTQLSTDLEQKQIKHTILFDQNVMLNIKIESFFHILLLQIRRQT